MVYEFMSLARPDIEKIGARGKAYAIMALGAIEQHGPHLPVGTDTYTSKAYVEKAAELVADRIGDKADLLVLPQMPYGLSVEHRNFAGVLSMSPETLLHFYTDIAEGLKKSGIEKLIIISGHGGNDHLMQVAAREMYKTGIKTFYCTVGEVMAAMNVEPWSVHACRVETSIMMKLQPDLVVKERIVPELSASKDKWMQITDMNAGAWEVWYTDDYAVDGVIGEPDKATPEFGEELFDKIVESMAKTVMYIIENDR